ncbi:hypothetical protein [Streptomyces ortus]|uniref:Uncharacterized protein n=1 Tax=Streptomyces ortus TaxID=2867268 RepID=A0ABT3UWW3_9ACTN|nr:hypothetical protein [Streptomyces ortus]MCX4232052.1 hypothetical protein [Streptomyces ortus]
MARREGEQTPGPVWEPTPRGEVRDPEAMEDTPSQIWGPGEDDGDG